jgi:hypothetical protein
VVNTATISTSRWSNRSYEPPRYGGGRCTNGPEDTEHAERDDRFG